MKLNLYNISDTYIEYLRKFDERVYDNKEENRIYGRKYIGLVLSVGDFSYYIPMSSPKRTDYIDYENKIIRHDTKTIIRMKDKNRLYGTLRISNMIPVPITELEPYVVEKEKDTKYKNLILGEIRYIDYNSNKIVKNAKLVYDQKKKNLDIGYIKNTVDFNLLEEKCKEWVLQESEEDTETEDEEDER